MSIYNAAVPSVATGSAVLVPAGTDGVIDTIKIDAHNYQFGGTTGNKTGVTIQLEDGDSNVLWTERFQVFDDTANLWIAELSALNIDYSNGVNVAVTVGGSVPAHGYVCVSVEG